MTTIADAEARYLDSLHAVVTAACAVVYNGLVTPGFDADRLSAAIEAEAKASKALALARRAEQQAASQTPLEGIA